MIALTRDQRKALKAVYNRAPIRAEGSSTMNLTYRGFRKHRVTGTFMCDGAICVAWMGMFLLIERDGYTHS